MEAATIEAKGAAERRAVAPVEYRGQVKRKLARNELGANLPLHRATIAGGDELVMNVGGWHQSWWRRMFGE